LLGLRIEIIDSGVDSDVVPPPEEEQQFCFDSRSILVSESVQNQFQNRLRINTKSTTLTSPISDEDSLVSWAAYTLSQIARWVDSAKAVVDAKALDHVLPLLESPNPGI
jgi:hypothetical protein